MQRFLFPRWTNPLLAVLGIAMASGGVFAGVMGGLLTDPQTLNVGYMPDQPVPYSHALHAGQLKIDCKYCHNTVDDAAYAAIPPTATCINCHSPADEQGITALAAVKHDSPKLKPIHDSWRTGQSVAWRKIHNLPEYVYFNHSAHVNSGVGCKTCHGRIDQMEVVYQHEQLSMAWCIECHRNYEDKLVPVDQVTNLEFEFETEQAQQQFAASWIEEQNIHPKVHCAVCHR